MSENTSPVIKGILFDKDGTLLDYAKSWMPLNRKASLMAAAGDETLAARILEATGYDAVQDRVLPGSMLAASSNGEIIAKWCEFLPGVAYEDLLQRVEKIFQEDGETAAVAVTDLSVLFDRLKARGLKLGVATSDSEQGARRSLKRFGAVEKLDFIAGYDSGHGLKPTAGMVQGFCAAMSLDPDQVMVVGDNLHDMEMGHNAGAGLKVGVLTGTSERDVLATLADHVLGSIEELETILT
ncbi:HAD family hydrolase [Kiloniella laminariae]|uniref:HAD family hydrolase n=1 Tax=Kiloniella laminariae TaxID=454162 RepID=UPI00035F935F|nr:HAD family hydrolase [Kiloniella laminariae]